MKKLSDYRLTFRDQKQEYMPIIQGAMGADISPPEMALEMARLGGIGHISDILVTWSNDKYFGTNHVRERAKKYKEIREKIDKSGICYTTKEVKTIEAEFVRNTMERKQGEGLVFLNVLQKATMNDPERTLKARLEGALDGGIDGISLGAGPHLNTFELIADHPRFFNAKLGIIVSSLRALRFFLRKNSKYKLPDFIVVEGPLAGGHLGFKIDEWLQYNLKTIMAEILQFLNKKGMKIPVIPAGGIFSGKEAVEMMKLGASAIQVATRFLITKEGGLSEKIKQKYIQADQKDIIVNTISPAGYPMRMLADSPCIQLSQKPQCESLGFGLDQGKCPYIDSWKNQTMEHRCLCHHTKKHQLWPCGAKAHRLKETVSKLPDGSYQIPTMKEVFDDYMEG